jgi:hypothetical protein
MKELCFNKKGVNYTPLQYWTTDKDTKVAIYQGSRGENPDLDFIVKYKEKGKRLRTPSHTHWIVDLLVKAEYNKNLLSSYVSDLINVYDETIPFTNVEERDTYELTKMNDMEDKYWLLNGHGYYSVKTLTSLVELFSKCEKQSTGAFMFKTLLELVKDYCDGKKDFYQIVGYSKRV